jgi:hypothetical protein
VNSFIFKKSHIGISVPMQDAFLFEAMKESHEQHKSKIDIDKFITGTTNMTLKMTIGVTEVVRTYVLLQHDPH